MIIGTFPKIELHVHLEGTVRAGTLLQIVRRSIVRGLGAVMSMSDAQAHITSFWSTVAPDYEAHSGNVAAYGTAAYQCWEDALAAGLPHAPAEILDVATGTGYVALAAAALGHHVTAIDLSPRMLEGFSAHAADRGLSVDARQGDAVVPDFPPASFDVVTSRHFLAVDEGNRGGLRRCLC